MVDNAKYQGYTDTDTAKAFSGIGDDDDDWPISQVNLIIKAVEKKINGDIGVTANLPLPVAEDLQLATAHLVAAIIKHQKPMPDTPTKDRTWREDLELGMMFIASYLKTPAAFRQRFGFLYQSGYLTKPSNPNMPNELSKDDW